MTKLLPCHSNNKTRNVFVKHYAPNYTMSIENVKVEKGHNSDKSNPEVHQNLIRSSMLVPDCLQNFRSLNQVIL